ncbi:hypothetical protein [Enterococcus phage ECP3]|uniref:Uncharacterized protein n=3 Tax=Kochikohdavirus TaxID=2560160 RepID=A0A9E7MHX5_9CAUD|nr:hypothetical protein [Enterococcus phage ECP3]AII28460.1 hypothetical protein [Enterococcus phage ECP3]QPW37210.1 hypothetical protein [Enterococcus phage PBEF129]USL84295.1 hypothetical protein Sw5_31 [Enterococcus phage Sw5]BBE37289.1 hypothetical protein PHIM1EF22_0160 [Enterococcus phage phiM1EF22]
MAKTLNDIIEDFDAQLNEKVKPTTDEEITKSVEEPTEPEKVEEGAEVEPEEKPNESEETAGNDGEESGVTETVEAEQEEPETVEEVAVEEPVEESAETVEKSDKTKENKDEEEEEDEEDEDKKKEKDKKDKDKKDKEDKEDIEKSTEVEQVIKSSEILGAMEAIFKNMLGLSEKLDEIHREFKEAKEAKEKDEAESVEKSLLDNPEIKTGKEDSEGKAVGFVNKSVAVEEDVATEEPTVEVIVDGEQDTAEPEKEVPFRDRVQAIRPDFMETYKRVSVSGVAQRGELESVRHTWGTARTNDDLAKIEGFINKYK